MVWIALSLLVSSPMDVAWDAPEGCPDGAAFEQRVLAEADVEPVDDDGPAPLRVRVTIRERSTTDWALWLELENTADRDRRELVGKSCEDVVDAAVVLTSMRVVEWIIEPDDVVVPAAPSLPAAPSVPQRQPNLEVGPPRPPLDRGPPSTSEPPHEGRSRPSRRARGPGSVLLRSAAGVAYGVLPSLGAAMELGVGYEGDHWRLGLAGRGAPARRGEHPTAVGVGGRFDLVGAQLDVCWAPTVGPVVLPVCGLVEAAGLRGVGRGDDAVVRWSPWMGLGGSFAAVWRISRFVAPRIALEGLGSVTRPGFDSGSAPGTLFEAGPGGLRVLVGIEVRLQIGPRKRSVAQTP